MSYKTKEAFWNTFHKTGKYFRPEKRLDAEGWLVVFRAYYKSIRNMMQNDSMASEIFPDRMKGDNEVEKRVCEACGKPFPITQKVKNWEKKKSEAEGHPVRNTICPNCKQSPAKRSVTSYTKPAAKYVAQKTRSTTSAATTAPKNNSASNRQSYAQKTIGIPSKITGAQRKQTAAKATSTVGSAQTTGENKEESFTSKVMLPVFAGCYIVALVYYLVEYGIEFFTYLFPLGLILGLIGVGMVAVFPAGIILGILYVLEAIIVAITKKKP